MDISSETIQQAIAILKKGGVVAFPTDTVYGLAATANNPAAIKRVFEIKERPLTQALPLVVASIEQAEQAARHIPALAYCLMRNFWPGALTLVLKKAAWVPDVLTAGSDTVAMRLPDDHIASVLINGVGVPLVGTSANVHGRPSPTTAAQVRAQLDEKIDMLIDGGPTRVGVESTIIDMTARPPRILRQGALPRQEIEKYCRLA